MLAVELISKLIRYEGISGCEGLTDVIAGKYVAENEYRSIATQLRNAHEHLDEYERSMSELLELAKEMDLRAQDESVKSEVAKQMRGTNDKKRS